MDRVKVEDDPLALFGGDEPAPKPAPKPTLKKVDEPKPRTRVEEPTLKKLDVSKIKTDKKPEAPKPPPALKGLLEDVEVPKDVEGFFTVRDPPKEEDPPKEDSTTEPIAEELVKRLLDREKRTNDDADEVLVSQLLQREKLDDVEVFVPEPVDMPKSDDHDEVFAQIARADELAADDDDVVRRPQSQVLQDSVAVEAPVVADDFDFNAYIAASTDTQGSLFD